MKTKTCKNFRQLFSAYGSSLINSANPLNQTSLNPDPIEALWTAIDPVNYLRDQAAADAVRD